MFQTADWCVQRPRGRAVSLTDSGDWLEEQGRLAKGVRGGAGEGRAGPSAASQTGELGSPGRLQSKGWSVCTTRGRVPGSQLSQSGSHFTPGRHLPRAPLPCRRGAPLPPGPLTRPVSSASTPSASSTTLAKLLALDEEREKSFSTSALWAAVSALPQNTSRQPASALGTS